MTSEHLCHNCGSLLRTSPEALLPFGKNRSQSFGSILSSLICLTANTNSRLPALPRWVGGIPPLRSRCWRKLRNWACNWGEERVSVSDRGLGGVELRLLDLEADWCGDVFATTGSAFLVFSRFFIWLRTPSWGFSLELFDPILKSVRLPLGLCPLHNSCKTGSLAWVHSLPGWLALLVQNQSVWGVLGTIWLPGWYLTDDIPFLLWPSFAHKRGLVAPAEQLYIVFALRIAEFWNILER